jgi:hypothetical protein
MGDIRRSRGEAQMRFFSDVLVFFGGLLLTFGTDLVVETAGQNLASVGGLLGLIASLLGTSMLVTGLLNHYRMSREFGHPVPPT